MEMQNRTGLFSFITVDGIGVFGGASWVIDVLSACGIISVAPPLAIALLIFGGICLVWDVLRYFGVI